MKPEIALSDKEFAEVARELADVQSIRKAFKRRYGDGWQRTLATNLGVAESTVSGWLKSGSFSPLARLSLGMLLLRHELGQSAMWRVVRAGDYYAVYSFDDPVGRLVANNIEKIEDARLIAAAPNLKETAGDAWVALDDANQPSVTDFGDGKEPYLEYGPFDQGMIGRLGDALDAAKLDPKSPTDNEARPG